MGDVSKNEAVNLRGLVNTPALAERLGFSQRSIQQWHRFGIITPAAIVSGRPRWRVADVRRTLIEATFSGKRRPYVRKPRPEGPGGGS